MNERATPYERIVRAAQRGTGCRLSALDCSQMARDDAISALAANDREDREDAKAAQREAGREP